MSHKSRRRRHIIEPLEYALRLALEKSRKRGATGSDMLSVLWKMEKIVVYMAFDEIDRLKAARRR